MSVYKDSELARRLEMRARHQAKLDRIHRESVRVTAETFRRPRRLVCRCAICEATSHVD